MSFMDGFWFQMGRIASEILVSMGVITIFVCVLIVFTLIDFRCRK
jgi:uncharacterized membrane protein